MARAVISVWDKRGVLDFARGLIALGFEIVSTGGTERALASAGIPVTNVSEITMFPECLDGRVKTLHPAIHAGILAMRGDEGHMQRLKELGIEPIDIVAINLYPFRETVAKEGASFEECIENIDIGGPTMLRAAAKNWRDVSVIADPDDYDRVLAEYRERGAVSPETRLSLALKVFRRTSEYDALIAGYLSAAAGEKKLPETLTLTYEGGRELRYGENPHQAAYYYKEVFPPGGTLAGAVQLHGKELSYNNINDTNGALEIVKEFERPCVVAVKHANPCGVGVGNNLFAAWERAYSADPVSIFGGIIAANREIDGETAAAIGKIFIEVVVAPSFSDEAIKILTQKKNIRLLALPDIGKKLPKDSYDMKKVAGGLLVQERDTRVFDAGELCVVTKRKPTEDEMAAMEFGYRVVKHVKSNAIALTTAEMTVGIGPGQTNRITAADLAIKYAGDRAAGSIMASDAFFPFPDCVEAAAKAGITAIIQPGGSVNDELSIKACDEHGIAMVFTKMRHFKH